MYQGGNLPVFLPLLAAGFDWLEGLLPFLFVGFWILSQVFAVFRRVNGRGGPRPNEAAPGPIQPRRPAQRPFAGNEPGPGGAAEPGRPSDLEEQIADFLRNVRGERPATPPPRAKRQPPQPVPATSPVSSPVRRPGTEADRRVGNLDASTAVARHVKDVFSHELKHLAAGLPAAAAREPSEAAPPRPPASRAEELANMLHSPTTIRQLILLREVLDRPVSRW